MAWSNGKSAVSAASRPLLVALGLAWAVGCAGLSRGRPVSLTVAGSDTMLPLVTRWAMRFMETHPGVIVRVAGGGSAAGIEQLIAGRIDVCATSCPLSADEVSRLYARFGTLGVTFRVAKDALAIFVNRDNPVRDLTTLQIKGIFTGRIRWWAKVGGVERPIRVLTRQPSSGTYRFFRELVLDGEPYAAWAEALPSTAQVAAEVASDPDAIGYGGGAHGGNVVQCTVDGVAATPDNIRSDSYPLSRYLYLVTPRPPEGWVRQFIDWVLDEDGQRVVREAGFVPVVIRDPDPTPQPR